MSAAVMPMRRTVSAPAICGSPSADATANISIKNVLAIGLLRPTFIRIAIFPSQPQWLKVMQRLCQRVAGGGRRKGFKKRAVVAFVNVDALSTIRAHPTTNGTVLHDLKANT